MLKAPILNPYDAHPYFKDGLGFGVECFSFNKEVPT